MKTILCSLVVLGLAGTSLLAQAPPDGFVATLGLTAAQGSTSSLNRQIWGGGTVEVGYRVTPPNYGVSLQPYLGWGKLPGKTSIPDRAKDTLWGPNTYDLTCLRVGLDVRFNPFDTVPLTFITGPAIHRWKVNRVGGGADIPQGGDNSALKWGWRLGMDYTFSARWSAGVLFTQSEWRSEKDVATWPGYKNGDDTPSYIIGLNPSRPAYFTTYVSLTF
jgi:hypothetical protein